MQPVRLMDNNFSVFRESIIFQVGPFLGLGKEGHTMIQKKMCLSHLCRSQTITRCHGQQDITLRQSRIAFTDLISRNHRLPQ